MLKRVIAVTNQKGGVGKTTTSINLSAALALAGEKVLVIDLDPQANCTSGLGIDRRETTRNIYNIFFEQKIQTVTKTKYNGLDVIPSHIDLVGIDIELINMPKREYILKNAIESVRDKYSFVILDCPPSLNLLTVNALTAADSVLIPVQCEYFALEGLTQLLNSIEMIRLHLNSEIQIEGFVLTMFKDNEKLSVSVRDDVKNHFKEKVFESIVPVDVALKESPSFGKPAIHYNPRAKGSYAYIALGKEIVDRYKKGFVRKTEEQYAVLS